jgi:hypothetical protein
MKFVVRTIVAALVLTGAVASTQLSSASNQKTAVLTKASALPTPMCPPDDPNACGLQ